MNTRNRLRAAALALLCGLHAFAAAQTTTTAVEPTPQKIEAASAGELKTFRAYGARAALFIASYVPAAKQPTLADADEAFRRWQQDKGRRRASDKDVVEMLGAFLGAKLAADFGMEWVVVTDENGRDYAVRATKHEAMAYPFASVEKRIDNRSHGFLQPIHDAVKELMESGEAKAR
jgi:hypothetical protein